MFLCDMQDFREELEQVFQEGPYVVWNGRYRAARAITASSTT